VTTPAQYREHADLSHIWAICSVATREDRPPGSIRLAGQRFPVRATMPTARAARTAVYGLGLSGYRAERVGGVLNGREVTVHGWSEELLEKRLAASRLVIDRLRPFPEVTGAVLIDQLAGTPAKELPDWAGRMAIVQSAARGIEASIGETCGLLQSVDQAARPADAGCALRLSAAESAGETIIDLGSRQLHAADHALGVYMEARRGGAEHPEAREVALRSARAAFPAPESPLAQDNSAALGATRARAAGRRRASGRHAGPAARGGRPETREVNGQVLPTPGTRPGPGTALPPDDVTPPRREDPPAPGGRRP
jgi:hypothetical protein